MVLMTSSGVSWPAWVTYIIAVTGLTSHVVGFTVNDETLLRSQALKNYSNEVRPNVTTDITLMLHVSAISTVDITNEIFALAGYWSMRWTDDRLAWTNYPSIPWVQYNPDKIWTPVLVVSNSLNDLSAIDEDTIPIRVNRIGEASWSPPGLLSVGCSMDVTYFPFDTQTCSVEVTSFGYTIQEIDIDLYSTGMSFRYFTPNGEWSMLSNYSQRSTYSEDGFTFARVTFYFEMERKPLYYGLNMLLPVMVCSAMTIFVFLLPAESGEKIGFCLTVLLAFMVILTLVATDLPTTATNTSILEIYIAIVLLMGGVSVIFSILALNCFFKPEDKEVPALIQKITSLGMRMCCYESSCRKRVEPKKESFRANRHGNDGKSDSTMPANQDQEDGLPYKPKLIKQQTMYGFRTQNSVSPKNDITWQTVAIVMDAVLFRVYSLFLLVSSVVILSVLTSRFN